MKHYFYKQTHPSARLVSETLETPAVKPLRSENIYTCIGYNPFRIKKKTFGNRTN